MKNPTQLFVGNKEKTTNYAVELLQKNFCKNNKIIGCFCTACKQIEQNQHPFVIWIRPETDYKLQDISIIFEKTQFSLDQNQQFFFVLDDAEKLTKSTANKLLKILEEPPVGYNFLLLTKNENQILPTIKSRCLISHLSLNSNSELDYPLQQYFLSQDKLNNSIEFEKELRNSNFSNSQAIEIIDQLVTYFKKQIITFYKSSENIELENLQNKITYLQNKLKYPPQNGSAKIFLKNIFLGLSQNPSFKINSFLK